MSVFACVEIEGRAVERDREKKRRGKPYATTGRLAL